MCFLNWIDTNSEDSCLDPVCINTPSSLATQPGSSVPASRDLKSAKCPGRWYTPAAFYFRFFFHVSWTCQQIAGYAQPIEVHSSEFNSGIQGKKWENISFSESFSERWKLLLWPKVQKPSVVSKTCNCWNRSPPPLMLTVSLRVLLRLYVSKCINTCNWQPRSHETRFKRDLTGKRCIDVHSNLWLLTAQRITATHWKHQLWCLNKRDPCNTGSKNSFLRAARNNYPLMTTLRVPYIPFNPSCSKLMDFFHDFPWVCRPVFLQYLAKSSVVNLKYADVLDPQNWLSYYKRRNSCTWRQATVELIK